VKAPRFWQSDHGSVWQTVLWPAALLYRFGGLIRRATTKPAVVKARILCVGNVTLGGAGKTPVVLALAKTAGEMGIRVGVVSRGYGGRLAGPILVDPRHHTADEVGDEPLLLAAQAPTWISRDRVQGALAAQRDGSELILLDDGFQNPSLHKNYALLVFDGGYGIGNGSVFPAGPLREPVDSALRRADMCLLVGQDRRKLKDTVLKNADVQTARLLPESLTGFESGSRYVAFAGIGIPDKFFQTLRDAKLDLADTIAYPDHYQYTDQDLNDLIMKAKKHQASLLTTRKDFVRVPVGFAEHVQVLDVALKCDTDATLERIVRKAMGHG